MAKRKKRQRDGLVHFDPGKLARRTNSLGLSKTALADEAGVSRTTIYHAFKGDGIFPKNAVLIAERLEIQVVELLRNCREPESVNAADEVVVGEWTVASYLGPWVTASNGLQIRVCDMQHRFVETRRGRGKWYDLLGLSSTQRDALQAHLVRHPTVCERIGRHRNTAENLNTLPGSAEDAWWVIDRQVPGKTLSDLIGDGFAQDNLPQLMRDIAQGLDAMHQAQVVFRELAPSRVIIAADDGRAVLTDFELAKLTDTGPTVSADWPDNPYQAPEVRGGTSDERSDLYSWARILLHAMLGELPAKGSDADLLRRAPLPKGVWKVASDCLSPAPSDRPRNVQTVLRAIARWGLG